MNNYFKDLKEIIECTGRKVRSLKTPTSQITIYSNKAIYHIDVTDLKDKYDFARFSIRKTKVKSLDDLMDFMKSLYET